ncbi:hypothetical protein ES703_62862 [subsurface metagenome]
MIEQWRSWDHLRYINDSKLLYRWPGVYMIRLIDATSEKPIPIGRFLRIDESGTLLIGVSNDLGGRLYDFYYSYLEDRRTHSEGRRLHLVRMLCKFEEEIFPESSMQFRVKRIPDEEQAKDEEERLLKSYFKHFGELPPLNTMLGKKRVLWTKTDTETNDPW